MTVFLGNLVALFWMFIVACLSVAERGVEVVTGEGAV